GSHSEGSQSRWAFGFGRKGRYSSQTGGSTKIDRGGVTSNRCYRGWEQTRPAEGGWEQLFSFLGRRLAHLFPTSAAPNGGQHNATWKNGFRPTRPPFSSFPRIGLEGVGNTKRLGTNRLNYCTSTRKFVPNLPQRLGSGWEQFSMPIDSR